MTDKKSNQDVEEKLEEIWQFPCDFPLKVMGTADDELLNEVMTVIQKYAPGEYSPKIKESKNGNYHSISVTIRATSKQQLDNLYGDLNDLEKVKMLL
ncbi:MAG TPA: DUF493 family protein [Aeromonadales bacterium]|nr:DUF493 family protein [Aeromonadales bacterium]